MASPNTTTTTVALGGGSPQTIGNAATSLVGFYGATPIVQPSGATQTTITATWVTISSGFGFFSSDQIISVIAAIQQIQTVLKTLGVWKGSA